MMVLDKIKSFGHLKKLIYKHVKFYKKSSKLHVWIYTCNKRDIVGIKWPIFLGNSHRTFSQFVIYTSPPKDLISIITLCFSLGDKVQQKYILYLHTIENNSFAKCVNYYLIKVFFLKQYLYLLYLKVIYL